MLLNEVQQVKQFWPSNAPKWFSAFVDASLSLSAK
jgi:hypothetical protein